ncbi:MAG TPA: FAD-dependent oxidoreductase [Ramlibacter sp.]|nr:FAD-dependent oxidoreductase [Ramlibacter sp.]
MADASPYRHLFSPFELAGQRLKNRIVHASISPRFGAANGLHPNYFHYFVNRASGGAAAVVTDPLGIAPHHGKERLTAWNDSMEADLRRLADGVRAHGSILLGQVQDSGRGRHVPGRSYGVLGPSPLPDDLSYTMPTPMPADEIRRFVESTAQSCRRLQACGFGGVEVSAGHGHLFHQFLSPRSNVREDEYGGDLAGRARLLVEVCQAIRIACGAGFILGVKLPGDDGVPGGIDADAAAQVAAYLVSRVNVDYLTYCQGSHHRTLEMHLPDESAPRLTYMGLIKRLRESTPGVPTMALGRITDPAEAEGILTRGDSEFIQLGRSLIVDPAWPNKAAQGRARDIRYCVSCNTCWWTINSGRSIGCDNNPRLATELELAPRLPAAPHRKRVVVIGAGLAGMEAAITAANRGHHVTVLGRSGDVGGKARLLARVPLSESLSSVYDFQAPEAQRLGVVLRLGAGATVRDVLALEPDEVVLATGSTMTWPASLPVRVRAEGLLPGLREALPPLLAAKGPQRGTAVLYDLDQTQGTYAVAEYLRDRFERVVLLTPRDAIADDVVLVMRQRIRRRFHERGIQVLTLVEPVWNDTFEEQGRLAYQSVYGGPLAFIEDVAFFSYASPRRPNDELLAPLRAAGLKVHVVGDAKYARETLAATAEGYAAGCAI